ncbi:MAG: ATP-binding cassette domain-containing protein [Bacteroidales bacterium]|nr:ATP-binding cassette domain-containing protein [Bacteroidales bacterium]
MNFFEAENITKHYAGHTALDGVSIEVKEQSIFGLLGPNGAGKTTFIRIINQIIGPDQGEIRIRGEKLHPNHIANIGYLPEERGLYKKMKVGEQAMYLARLKGLSKIDAHLRLKEWFQKFEIENWWNKKVEELSKGMAQKVQFIVTVVHEPSLLIFDEPFSGFDPINAELLKQEILQLSKKGSTILFSTHNMSSVEELCDNIALINQAKVILKGEMNSIKQEYKTNSYQLKIRDLQKEITEILPENFNIKKLSDINDCNSFKVDLPDNVSSNELLQKVMPHGQISSFEEILPTMNEIFIRKVTEAGHAK